MILYCLYTQFFPKAGKNAVLDVRTLKLFQKSDIVFIQKPHIVDFIF